MQTTTEESQATPQDVFRPKPSVEEPIKDTPADTTAQPLAPSIIDTLAPSTDDLHPSPQYEDNTPAVRPERKQELLLQARADRVAWIQQVPLPYQPATASCKFASCHVAIECPSIMPLLEHMYTEDGKYERMNALLNDEQAALPSGDAILQKEREAQPANKQLKDFQSFLKKLQDPSCAVLVQGVRRFVHQYGNVQETSELSRQILSYLSTISKSIAAHKLWKEDAADFRPSLESWLYGHVRPHIDKVLWTKEAQTSDREWQNRLGSLQFVTAQHLDVSCLVDCDAADVLREPISLLQSLSKYHSPYDMLQCILRMYHDINAALKQAMNRNGGDKLPSADDVLPAIILTILKAQPDRLLKSLSFVEEFSPAEYVRGEAGYAFTNLYGGVHFLQELDMSSPNKLSISEEDFRVGLERSRIEAETKRKQHAESNGKTYEIPAPKPTPPMPIAITLEMVHSAREEGTTVDIVWARGLLEKSNSKEAAESEIEKAEEQQTTAWEEAIQGLPAGFQRQYRFMTSDPSDIAYTDIPDLLQEYRALVNSTEKLIGDRAYRITTGRKQTAKAAEQDLWERVRQVDPDLLPEKLKDANK